MQKWEYCIFTAYETSQQNQYTLSYARNVENLSGRGETRISVFEKLGGEGWELVSVHPVTIGVNEFYFKRAIL